MLILILKKTYAAYAKNPEHKRALKCAAYAKNPDRKRKYSRAYSKPKYAIRL